VDRKAHALVKKARAIAAFSKAMVPDTGQNLGWATKEKEPGPGCAVLSLNGASSSAQNLRGVVDLVRGEGGIFD